MAWKRAWFQPIGIALGLVGLLVGAYSFTGPRAYDLTYFFVTVGGLLLMFGGMGLAAYGRVFGGGKRLARKPLPPGAKKLPRPAPEAPPAIAEVLVEVPVTAPVAQVVVLRTRVQCPRCEAVFWETGEPPFCAACPECGLLAEA